MPAFADIILPLAIDGVYTYAIPHGMQGVIAVGDRVLVPLKTVKQYTGVVFCLHDEEPKGYEVKEIVRLWDDQIRIRPEQISLWSWLSSYYMCSLGEVMKAALPSVLKLETESKVSLNEAYEEGDFNPDEQAILALLSATKKYYTIGELSKLCGRKSVLETVNQLHERGVVSVDQQMKKTPGERKARYIGLTEVMQDDVVRKKNMVILQRAKVQYAFIQEFAGVLKEEQAKVLPLSVVRSKITVSDTVLKSLKEKGFIEEYTQEKYRSLAQSDEVLHAPHQLNHEQEQAYKKIMEVLKKEQPCLLHGVTGSGKTEVYIHLIKEVIARGEQVLFLVPEIALTPQMTSRLKRIFGDKLAVYHSKLSMRERGELWKRQADDQLAYPIVLGARSAVFLPFTRLGLVIVDEEHESSYKQFDPNPRYNARDTALLLASLFKAQVILGSATPSIESYFNAEQKKYALVELKSRHQDTQMPLVKAVDMREVYRKKQQVDFFSKVLIKAIEDALERKKQVILFQNRRGYAPYLSCGACGYVQRCKFCDVSMTYYRHSNILSCHYCGYSVANRESCPECKEGKLSHGGFGTEKVEELLHEIFPTARVARMDLNSTREKEAYDKIIGKLENHEIDILIGTQMVAKGLDFSRVALVGIMNADSMLNFPDFRAFERSFQLMAQVSGRAGRSEERGLVILQTSDPNHPIVRQVIEHDYRGMYEVQRDERRLFRYPPFYRMIKINLKHRDSKIVEHAMHVLAHHLRFHLRERVLGPQWPPVAKVQNKYVKTLIIKIERDASLSTIKSFIVETWKSVKSDKKYKSVTAVFDVDPA